MGLTASCNLTEEQNPVQSAVPVEELSTTDATLTTPSQTIEITGNWQVHLLVEDGFDLTENFQNIDFNFSDSGDLEGKLGEETIAGRWRVQQGGTYQELYLDFPAGTILEELKEDWYLMERSENVLVLEERDEETTDMLVLVKANTNPEINSPFATNQEKGTLLFKTLLDNQFIINRLMEDNRDWTWLFDGVRLRLLPFGRLVIQQPDQAPLLGTWKVGFNNQQTKLGIELQDGEVSEFLDEDWLLQSKNNGLIQLIELDESDRDQLELLKITG